jgi:hypothetical protein
MPHSPLRLAAVLSIVTIAVLSAQTPAAQAGRGGFKVGDTVKIDTAFGWMDAKVLRINGNNYYVHAQSGADVWKPYPTELRRIGPINAEDRANGLYQLHDRVQVNVEGRWMDGEVTTEKGLEYQVAGGDKPLPAAKGGTPPKPGMVSCAGKIEGRYSSSAGLGIITIVFRAGKASVPDITGGTEDFECWMSGTKIILRRPGAPGEDMPLDINNDGSIDTPLGEIKKKGN